MAAGSCVDGLENAPDGWNSSYPEELPPQEELKKLLELTRLGDIRTLQQHVRSLQSDTPQLGAFGATLSQFTRHFRVDELQDFIEQCLHSASV